MMVISQFGKIIRTLTRLTRPGAHVVDLAPEIFLRLFRALPEFRGDSALSTYLYRITLNVAQDEWKRRRREREHLTDLHSPPAEDARRHPALSPSTCSSCSSPNYSA